MLRKSSLKAPADPGIYLFKSVSGRVLYVGKARNLKQRIRHYFQKDSSPMTARLLERSHRVDFVLTDNESEALQLEYNFIHHYNPPFNIRLKDDKSYPMVEISSGDPFPGIYFSRNPAPESFATPPLADSRRTRALIDLVMRVFRIRNCGRSEFNRRVPCLYHHIDRCSAPCVNRDQRAEYLGRVEDAVAFLQGRKAGVIRKLEKRMRERAEEEKYEEAQRIKDDIRLLKEFRLDSVVAARSGSSFDALALHLGGASATVLRFFVDKGHVVSRDLFSFSTFSDTPAAAMREFILTAYGSESIPRELIVSPEPQQRDAMEEFFSRMTGHAIRIRVPQRGLKRKVLDMASRNLSLAVARNHYPSLGEGLRGELGLSHFPHRIEGIDISHFSGRERVGSVVVFEEGQPVRSEYRNYRIQTERQGDTDAIREVMERRFGKGSPPDPDLILIDGGVGQLNTAIEVKRRIGFRADLVSLAKKEERIFCESGVTVVFPPGSAERFLFQNVRDEAHRRAVTHHRKRRMKKT